MTNNDSVLIPWSLIMDQWEEQDIRAYNYFWDYFFDKDYSPYKQLIQIHKIKGDTNEEFHDSLMSAIHDTAASYDAGNPDDKDFEIEDICKKGVYVNMN